MQSKCRLPLIASASRLQAFITQCNQLCQYVKSFVKAGEKMHQRAGVKLHQDGMPKASIGGLLLGDKQDEKRIASPENVTQASSVASPPMFPLPH